jgi:hypothetical protein
MKSRELTQKLKDLRGLEAAGTPQEGWVLSSREVLMNQISPKADVGESSREFGSAIYYFQHFGQIFNQRILKPVAVALVVVFLLVSYTATVSVADASLPGDMLYSVKTTRERVKLAFTFGEENKVKLQMDHVSRRVDELHGLVAQGGDSVDQAENVASTAQKISDDVKLIKDSLNRITTAASNGGVLEIAKDIDSKTLAVGHGLAEVKEALALTVSFEAIDDIDEAIGDTEDVGTAALVVIINKFEAGKDITGDEVAARVAERIKDVEADIQSFNDEEEMSIGGEMLMNIEEGAESTVSSTVESIDVVTTSIVSMVVNDSDDAQASIEEARDLLGQKDFGLAIEKLMQTNDIVDILESESGIVKGESGEVIDSAVTTTDELVEEEE